MNKILWVRACTNLMRRTMSTPLGPPGPNAASASRSPNNMMSPKFRPSDFQKFILVWTKKYKSKEEIPTFVSYVHCYLLKLYSKFYTIYYVIPCT